MAGIIRLKPRVQEPRGPTCTTTTPSADTTRSRQQRQRREGPTAGSGVHRAMATPHHYGDESWETSRDADDHAPPRRSGRHRYSTRLLCGTFSLKPSKVGKGGPTNRKCSHRRRSPTI